MSTQTSKGKLMVQNTISSFNNANFKGVEFDAFKKVASSVAINLLSALQCHIAR